MAVKQLGCPFLQDNSPLQALAGNPPAMRACVSFSLKHAPANPGQGCVYIQAALLANPGVLESRPKLAHRCMRTAVQRAACCSGVAGQDVNPHVTSMGKESHWHAHM